MIPIINLNIGGQINNVGCTVNKGQHPQHHNYIVVMDTK